MKTKHIVIAFFIFAAILIVYQLYGSGIILEHYRGSDDQSVSAIQQIAPNYKPWFSHVIEFKSDWAEPVMFTVQAALGLSILGYYIIKRQKKVK